MTSHRRPATAAIVHLTSAALLLMSCSTTPPPAGLAGSYQGSALGRLSPYGESLVEGLEVTEHHGTYSLTGYMNDTNREPGMTNISNTRSSWSGTGTIRDGALVFTYSDAPGHRATGSLRPERTGRLLLLTLDRQRYHLYPSPPRQTPRPTVPPNRRAFDN